MSPGGLVSPDLPKALSQRYGVDVTLVEADLALGPAAAEALREALGDRDVGVLVNCGAGPPARPGPLTEASEQGLLELVNRAVVAAALMTRLVLPQMVERGRGALVQLCSGAGGRSSGAALLASQVGGERALLNHHSRAPGPGVQLSAAARDTGLTAVPSLPPTCAGIPANIFPGSSPRLRQTGDFHPDSDSTPGSPPPQTSGSDATQPSSNGFILLFICIYSG